jgi:DNA polymerase-3 subunit epsilon
MHLFFDTETTGLPKDWNVPVTQLDNWPRVIQIAWHEYEESGTCVSRKNYLIKPDGFKIPYDSVRIHGISTDQALSEGVELKPVLEEFAEAVKNTDCLVAHNISFDEHVVGAEFLRAGMENCMDDAQKLCLMRTSAEYCKILGPYGYKWPSLKELYFTLFHGEFKNAHDADVDVDISAKCFFELKSRKFY